MSSHYTKDTLDPSRKFYGDMRKEEVDLVRLQAEEAAQNFIQKHQGKSFFLRIAGTIIAAAGKNLEPATPEPTSGAWDD